MRPRFSELDESDDGILDREELEKAVQRRRPTPGAGGPGGSFNMADMMLRRDQDGDGKLSKEEVPPRMAERFDQMDSNQDGSLDRNELQSARRQNASKHGLPTTGSPTRAGATPGAVTPAWYLLAGIGWRHLNFKGEVFAPVEARPVHPFTDVEEGVSGDPGAPDTLRCLDLQFHAARFSAQSLRRIAYTQAPLIGQPSRWGVDPDLKVFSLIVPVSVTIRLGSKLDVNPADSARFNLPGDRDRLSCDHSFPVAQNLSLRCSRKAQGLQSNTRGQNSPQHRGNDGFPPNEPPVAHQARQASERAALFPSRSSSGIWKPSEPLFRRRQHGVSRQSWSRPGTAVSEVNKLSAAQCASVPEGDVHGSD